MSSDVLTEIAGAVVALERSSSFTFLLAQRNGVLQGCRDTRTHKNIQYLYVIQACKLQLHLFSTVVYLQYVLGRSSMGRSAKKERCNLTS